MPLLGAHMSTAGGYHKAVRAGAALQMDCVQLFTKNNNQWKAKPITEAEATQFTLALKETGLQAPLAHNSYLINLCAAAAELRQKSVDALVVELQRAAQLGIPHVVAHPGAHCGQGEEVGLAAIATSLDEVFERTADLTVTVALELTAGQGTCLGHRFEHLAEIIAQCRYPQRLTVCLDTCHVFAAGYALAPEPAYHATMDEFAKIIGFARLAALHLNDSKKPRGSRVDRHEHIGQGYLGIEPFTLLLTDPRLASLPMYLETPKENDPESGLAWDERNLATLRRLATGERK